MDIMNRLISSLFLAIVLQAVWCRAFTMPPVSNLARVPSIISFSSQTSRELKNSFEPEDIPSVSRTTKAYKNSLISIASSIEICFTRCSSAPDFETCFVPCVRLGCPKSSAKFSQGFSNRIQRCGTRCLERYPSSLIGAAQCAIICIRDKCPRR